jgi:ABC-type phosphate/phosphonate transport system substrate-binding protein
MVPFAAGVADYEETRELIEFGAPLKVLKILPSPNGPWVATTNLAPVLRTRMQRSLISLKDGTILAGISRGLTGFLPATSADYDELERQIKRSELFDQSPEAPK